MLNKTEILKLVNKTKLSAEETKNVEMILRNFEENDLVTNEKLEIICKLIIKK
jgi:hypothetical protein